MKLLKIAMLGLIALLGLSIALDATYFLTANGDPGSSKVDVRKMLWRSRILGLKASGSIPDLTWSELWFMIRAQGGFGLESIVARGASVDGAVRNPYGFSEDQELAEDLFRQHCAGCHGDKGAGGHAPALNQPNFKHGSSDLAIYRVIRDGVSNTGMPRVRLTIEDRWRLAGYIERLQHVDPQDAASGLPQWSAQVTTQDIAASPTADSWLTYSGSLNGQRYTKLNELTPKNVGQLRLRWIHQFETNESIIETVPIVVNGVAFVTEPPSNVVALDLGTGNVRWRYTRHVSNNIPLCCVRVNRGVAILGNTLYLATLDGYLVALDAASGRLRWQTQVASTRDGYSMTGAPLIANEKIIVGVAGGEFGIRGFLSAYDTSGKELWKFHTIPGPGEFGHETWSGDAWKEGGGPTWVTGSFDPELDLVYWGVGNPGPDFMGDVRPGDNLFTDSVIALNAKTGKRVWHFQFTPHDEHDWDATQTPVLADLEIQGVKRKALLTANRNGFYYVLDRVTGEYLLGRDYVEQNWAKGLDAKGRPILAESPVLSKGFATKPGVGGGANWQSQAFDPRGWFLVPALEGESIYTRSETPVHGDGGAYLGSAGMDTIRSTPVVRALDAATGTRKWEYFSPTVKDHNVSYSGLLATGGNLVFGVSGGTLFALNSTSGREEWKVTLGTESRAAPISVNVDGHQALLVAAGRALFLFGL